MKQRVAILMVGLSREREVSLSTGQAVAKAVAELGHEAIPVDVGADIAQVLAALRPDMAFNALHGRYGEDGCVQGVLEILGIPYTHSGVRASAVAMHKPAAKQIFVAEGLRVAQDAIMTYAQARQNPPFAPPFVLKPISEGSSVGVKIVHALDEFAEHDDVLEAEQALLIEQYIPGREIQVAVLDDEPLGAIEIRPRRAFYDYEAKYTAGQAEHLMPAPLPQREYEEVMQLALRAHRALGCRGLTRSDFRYDDTGLGQGLFYILETNTQPGMTPLSLSPEIAAHRGMDFNTLVARLLADASTGR